MRRRCGGNDRARRTRAVKTPLGGHRLSRAEGDVLAAQLASPGLMTPGPEQACAAFVAYRGRKSFPSKVLMGRPRSSRLCPECTCWSSATVASSLFSFSMRRDASALSPCCGAANVPCATTVSRVGLCTALTALAVLFWCWPPGPHAHGDWTPLPRRSRGRWLRLRALGLPVSLRARSGIPPDSARSSIVA